MAAPAPEPHVSGLRISDADREQLVRTLGTHVGAGRLTLTEFDERVARVYRAVTEDQARLVLADLPTPTPPAPIRHPVRDRVRGLPLHQRLEWSAWLAVGVLNLAIWGIVSLAVGTMLYPWPVWVIGPWGLVLLGRTVLGIEGGAARRAPCAFPVATVTGNAHESRGSRPATRNPRCLG
ncbi:DUF1707 SHOCT-like domain-containing protein [Rhodococcus phenolicus]|uniref:DUF1707 SHOCT-like domain-containing protein n=1 Tax=Rhodococcus phenolicus TaxID=263849 RepID=UPI000833E659|nr:DUF1707 domain-containing protein [Rhodococcus phenolicus]